MYLFIDRAMSVFLDFLDLMVEMVKQDREG